MFVLLCIKVFSKRHKYISYERCIFFNSKEKLLRSQDQCQGQKVTKHANTCKGLTFGTSIIAITGLDQNIYMY